MHFIHNLTLSLGHIGFLSYWLMLALSFLESLVFVGIFVPGTTIVVFTGFLAAQGLFNMFILLWFVTIGAILGDALSYYLGTKGKHLFSNENKYLKLSHLEGGQKFFKKHGSKSVFLGRFVGPLRAIVPFIAGLSRMKMRIFFTWNITSAFLWSLAYLYLGYFFGGTVKLTDIFSTKLGYIGVITLIFFLVIYLIKYIIIKKGRKFFKFFWSLCISIWHGILSNHDIQTFLKKHDKFSRFLKKRFDRHHFLGFPMTVIGLFFLYLLGQFISITMGVLNSGAIVGTDTRIEHLISFFRDPRLVKLFLWITFLGTWQIIVSAAIAISLLFWIWKKKDYIVFLWLAIAGDGLLSFFSKNLFQRPRPLNAVYTEHTFSFPSGHSMIAVVFYGFLAYLAIKCVKKWGRKVNIFFAFLLVAFSIGYSRLYLGVHYFSDVWGGYILGLLWLIIVISIFEWLRFKNRETKTTLITPTLKLKAASAALILAELVFYVFFTARFLPPLKQLPTPTRTSIEVTTDLPAFFASNKLPRYTETITGQQQEPLSFVLMAQNDQELIGAFEKSSWFLGETISFRSLAKALNSAISNQQDLTAPITPSFWDYEVNDFGFQKATELNTVRQRHHVRIWKTNFSKEGKFLYIGTASFDSGIKWFITHKINPDIDTEREYIMNTLVQAGAAENSTKIQFAEPTLGQNFLGDQFFTDGKLYIVNLKASTPNNPTANP